MLVLSLYILPVHAQQERIDAARMALDMQDIPKAVSLYKELHQQQPGDDAVYDGYLKALIAAKDYKTAMDVANARLKTRPQDGLTMLDIGGLYGLMGKDKKAAEVFEQAVQTVNGDDLYTTRLAESFTRMKQDAYAIKTYERARAMLHTDFLYTGPLSRLYAKTGQTENAVNILLIGGQMQPNGEEDVKATLLEILGDDEAKLATTQKTLIKRINELPDNPFYTEILTWLYTRRDDWDGALMQIAALDARLQEQGRRLLGFARSARADEQYEVALKALDIIAEDNKDSPLVPDATAEGLSIRMQRLRADARRKPQDIQDLRTRYEQLFAGQPQYKLTQTMADYAELLAQFAGAPRLAIQQIETTLGHPGVRRDFSGRLRLQMGDYLMLTGDIWDASLKYSQVDKDFREDALGEEARFRNAKLSWYRGDFEWAEGQLSVLKASTSELIANDALYLSVLITENIPPDSNLVPLQRFAYADLLLFQNKDSAAAVLLDSIAKTYPDHPLQDDILMQQAKIARRRGDYKEALALYAQVYDAPKGGKRDDLLADDALFSAAEVQEQILKDNKQARALYETLILRFPGSSFVQRARERMAALDGNTKVP